MKQLFKIIRYYYWLVFGFSKKNIKFIIFSFIFAFFFILLVVNFFPYFNIFFLKRKEKIGLVGKYTLQNIPPEIRGLISNPLVSINSEGKTILVLAKIWEMSPDKKKYRFYLRSDLFWNDGKPFTAYDINFQFKDVVIRVVNDHTIEFELKQPLAIFPVYLTQPIIKYPLKGVAGLYQVDGYKLKNNYLTTLYLLPNKEGLPYKIYKFYDTEDQQIIAYRKGEIDTIKTYRKNIASSFFSWKNTLVKRSVDYSQILTLFFNLDSNFLSSKEIRKALAYLIPSFNHLGEKASGPISPLSWAYFPELKKYGLNEEKAKNLFKNAKEATVSSELNFYTFYDYIEVAEEIKKNFEKTGIRINLQILSYMPNKFDLFLTIWNPPIDPDQYYIWHSSSKKGNITGYRNLKVDKLLEDGRNTIDINERKKIYKQFQEIIVDDIPAYFIYYPYVYTIERK